MSDAQTARGERGATDAPRAGDILFGRKKLKNAAEERLFAISTARVTLESELGLKPSAVAAVCLKPLAAGEFVRTENELQELLDVAAGESSGKMTTTASRG